MYSYVIILRINVQISIKRNIYISYPTHIKYDDSMWRKMWGKKDDTTMVAYTRFVGPIIE